MLSEIRRLRAMGIPPRLIVLKARQVGISTLTEALLFWYCLTQPNISSLVIAHTLKSSKTLFRMSRNFFRFLPRFKQETRIENVHEIEFDSGSRMQVEVQGDPRGYAAQAVHLSEFAFYENPEDTLTAVMQTLPRITDSLCIIESTAKGVGNKFHKMWQRATGLALDAEVAEDEKGWTPIFVPWFKHEEYEIPVNEKFLMTADERSLCDQHPDVTLAKLKWRRWCISTNLDGDEELFAQEYPATPHEAFSLSGRPAFDTRAIQHYTEELAKVIQSKQLPARREIESDPPGIGVPNIVIYDRGRLRIFFEPEDRHTYIIGADPSEGDPGSDHSPLAVLDEMTMNLAATWYGKAPPDVLACHAIDVAKHYREGLIIHEANNHGILFGETVLQIGYPSLYFRKVSDESVAGEITEKPGYLSTRRNREYLFNSLRKYVRMRMGKILCPHMVQQIQGLVYIDDKVQAGTGSEKDLLVAFALTLMAHRGSMANPLEPHALEFVREQVTTAQLMKERQGGDAAREFLLVRTGMSMEECEAVVDATYAQDARKRKYGLGGLR